MMSRKWSLGLFGGLGLLSFGYGSGYPIIFSRSSLDCQKLIPTFFVLDDRYVVLFGRSTKCI